MQNILIISLTSDLTFAIWAMSMRKKLVVQTLPFVRFLLL